MKLAVREWSVKAWFTSLSLVLWLVLGTPLAVASVHTYPEGGDRVLYRSLQTLRDRTDHAWQVVVFKRLDAGQVESLHLRLVGFPGVAELQHPCALKMTTGTETVLLASDLLTQRSRTPNVGEYDVLEVMRQLDSSTPLRLALPTHPHTVELLVPPFVVQEWRQIAASSPNSLGAR